MRRGVWLIAALLSAALACDACTPDAPAQTPTPAPSPTFSCSTSTVNDPCTADKAKKEKEQAVAIAASTAAYKGFLAEWNRVGKAGGTTTPTPAMQKYAAGPYLKGVTQFLKEVKDAGAHYSSGSKTVEFKVATGESRRPESPSKELTFYFCQDGRNNKVVSRSGQVISTGGLGAGRMYFRPISGSWKIWDATDREVGKCTDGY